MEKLKQKIEYVRKKQKRLKVVCVSITLIYIVACVFLFAMHTRFADWDKIVVCIASVLWTLAFIGSISVLIYYSNYKRYLSKISIGVVQKKLVFAEGCSIVYKYGMRFRAYKFISNSTETILYGMDSENYQFSVGNTYLISYSGNFICSSAEVAVDE